MNAGVYVPSVPGFPVLNLIEEFPRLSPVKFRYVSTHPVGLNLLMPQSDQRVEFCRPPCRNVACQHGNRP